MSRVLVARHRQLDKSISRLDKFLIFPHSLSKSTLISKMQSMIMKLSSTFPYRLILAWALLHTMAVQAQVLMHQLPPRTVPQLPSTLPFTLETDNEISEKSFVRRLAPVTNAVVWTREFAAHLNTRIVKGQDGVYLSQGARAGVFRVLKLNGETGQTIWSREISGDTFDVPLQENAAPLHVDALSGDLFVGSVRREETWVSRLRSLDGRQLWIWKSDYFDSRKNAEYDFQYSIPRGIQSDGESVFIETLVTRVTRGTNREPEDETFSHVASLEKTKGTLRWEKSFQRGLVEALGIESTAQGLIVDRGRRTNTENSTEPYLLVETPFEVLASIGDPVAGLPGWKIAQFGLPGPAPFRVIARSGAKEQSLYLDATRTAILKPGDTIPFAGGGSAKISRLGNIASGTGTAVFELGNGVNSTNDTALLTGIGSGTIRIAAREGQIIDPATQTIIRTFLAFDGRGSTVFALVRIAGSKVSAGNDLALVAYREDGSLVRVIQTGKLPDDLAQQLNETSITELATIGNAPGNSPNEGRWRAGEHAIGMRLRFSSGRSAILTATVSSEGNIAWTRLAGSRDLVDGLRLDTFSMPGFSDDGSCCITARTVPQNGVTQQILFRVTASGPDSLLRFSPEQQIGTPCVGAQGRAITNLAPNERLRVFEADGRAFFIAPRNQLATDSGTWRTIESMAFAEGDLGGALFSGTVTGNWVFGGTSGVSSRRGLWFLDNQNILQSLIQTGYSVRIDGVWRIVRSVVTLENGASTRGTTQSYDDNAAYVIVKFEDGKTSLLRIPFRVNGTNP